MFEQGFVIGVVLKVDPSVAPGKLAVPGRLRYQACDETMCTSPRVETSWSSRCSAVGAGAPGRLQRRLRSARGAPARCDPARDAPVSSRPTPRSAAAAGDADRALDGSPSWERPAVTRHRRLPHLHSAMPRRASREGHVRRARPDRNSADCAGRRPGAEPDAVRAADDSDQPGDHRRRRQAGSRSAGSCSASPTAPPWRSSTACSA